VHGPHGRVVLDDGGVHLKREPHSYEEVRQGADYEHYDYDDEHASVITVVPLGDRLQTKTKHGKHKITLCGRDLISS